MSRADTSKLHRALALLVVFLAAGCESARVVSEEGSETHFLESCASSCADGLECLCGVCTRACTDGSECASLGGFVACTDATPRLADGRCESLEQPRVCDVPCLADVDCAALGSATCERGFCRVHPGSSGPGEPLSCEAAALGASEVMVLGDVVIELSSFATHLESNATNSGMLRSGEHFRNYASSARSFLAANQFSLGLQYQDAQAEGAARVVIMTGGAADVLNLPCGSSPAPDCPAVVAAVAGAEALFQRMAADGVEHVVYFFYPDTSANPGLRAGIDALRPLLENACGRSPVACHWLDLRPTFTGHPDYLVGVDGIVFGDPGAVAGAAAVWSLMEERCLAPRQPN
jgi:hypothetical protein